MTYHRNIKLPSAIAASLILFVGSVTLAQKRTTTRKSTSTTQSEENTARGSAIGKRINFVDGGYLQVDDAWRRGDEVWYRRGNITETANRRVKSIDSVYAETTEVVKPEATAVRTPEPTAETWIYLVGGARFKADHVREVADGAWYHAGNLTNFIDKGRIERIERGSIDTGSSVEPWTSGSGLIDGLIKANGARFGVDSYLLFLVIEQESHFRTRAVSPKGARGLMQLMPGTARRFGVKQAFDPAQNIRGGTQYLKELLQLFNGRVDLALASYNAGEGRVIEYGNRVPPFRETQNYVKRIGRRYGKDRKPAATNSGVRPLTQTGVNE